MKILLAFYLVSASALQLKPYAASTAIPKQLRTDVPIYLQDGIASGAPAPVDALVGGVPVIEQAADISEPDASIVMDTAAFVETDTAALCRRMLARFERGQERLLNNHGLPVLHGPAVLDAFVRHLTNRGAPAEVTAMLQRMRQGALQNAAGGTRGGRLPITESCLNKEVAFSRHVEETYFRKGDSVHFELFPSTTKSVEAFCALLAHEASLRERPIKILVPKDAHFCWTNVLDGYSAHPYLKALQLDPDDADDASLKAARFRPGDLVVGVFTFAATVSGRTTPVAWFQKCLAHCESEGATTAWFVDAALAGLCVTRDCLDLCADADPAAMRAILDGAMAQVQSGFKDFGLSSMLFLDDAGLESCSAAEGDGLQSYVSGGSHAIIKHAPITSIPESPTIAFLLYAKEYTAFRKQTFEALMARIRAAIPDDVEFELRPMFPLLHVEFADAAVAAALGEALLETYSLYDIDDEPRVLRLWPTPTNHDVANDIAAFFE